MYAASSSGGSASDSSSTTSLNFETLRGTGTQNALPKRAPRNAKSRHSMGSSQSTNNTLQSLVRTKCWSIAPLWKFVTYELEHQPVKQPQNLSRTASVRSKKPKSISYENNLAHDYMMANNYGKRAPIWSKPHPGQSLKNPEILRQPLQQSNRIHDPQCKVHNQEIIGTQNSVPENVVSVPEWKPCGVLKKPGSYRSHAGLKKVAFLENTELNRSTL